MLYLFFGGGGPSENNMSPTECQKAMHHRAAAFAKSHSEMFF